MSFDMREVRASDYVVAAMCGNWYQESGVNPGIWETLIVCPWNYMHTNNPKAGGYGFGQWTNTESTNMRCLNLHNWVTSNGYQDGDGSGQLMFMGVEDIWNLTSPRLHLPNLKSFFDSTSTNVEDLCYDFLICWEGINDGTFPTRRDKAVEFLTYIRQHANDNPADYATAISGNRHLSEAETLHNVMFVYFALNGYLGSPGLRPEQFIMLAVAGRKGRTGKFNVNGKRKRV